MSARQRLALQERAELQGFGRPVLEEDWARIRQVGASTRRFRLGGSGGAGG